MLIVTRVVFANATAAREATTKELVGERLGDEDVTVKEEPGLGDTAYWASSPTAAEYIVVKGPAVGARVGRHAQGALGVSGSAARGHGGGHSEALTVSGERCSRERQRRSGEQASVIVRQKVRGHSPCPVPGTRYTDEAGAQIGRNNSLSWS